MSRLLSGAIPELVASMRFRMARQGVLAANVSNADTPGYRRQDLEFDSQLERASTRMRRTHPDHLGQAGSGPGNARITRGPAGSRPDGNGVDLDHEVVQLGRNAGAFQDQASVLARLLVLRRIGATGESS